MRHGEGGRPRKGERMAIAEWQQRIVNERNELSMKLDKLKDFIAANKVMLELPQEAQDRLLRQCWIMQLYEQVLQERIAALKIEG